VKSLGAHSSTGGRLSSAKMRRSRSSRSATGSYERRVIGKTRPSSRTHPRELRRASSVLARGSLSANRRSQIGIGLPGDSWFWEDVGDVDDDVRRLVRVPEAAVRVAALLVVEDKFT
jgi:hypothetical protein